MRHLGLLALLAPAIASAQPGAVEPVGAPVAAPEPIAPPSSTPQWAETDPQVLALARGTRAAAARGDCVGARALGAQLARLDPTFHATVIRTDPVITGCRPMARQYSIAATRVEEPANAYLPAREGTPSISSGLLAGELLVGGLATVGGAFLGGALGVAASGGCNDNYDCLGGLILGGFLGGTIGAAVGVNFIGDTDEAEGSFGLALGGSVIGGLVGVGLISESNGGGGAVFVLIAAPTLGAMLGHNLSRSYKPQRAPRGPTYDRRLAIQPSQRIVDGTSFSVASGTF